MAKRSARLSPKKFLKEFKNSKGVKSKLFYVSRFIPLIIDHELSGVTFK